MDIRFYDGIPGEGGELLGTYTYHKQPEWMVFKPETFKLPKLLRGVHTFAIESDSGYQVSGFTFERRRREFTENNAANAEHIYGDKFTVSGESVTGIGNNVVLDFGEFDFTGEQPSKVVICGASPLPLNSIHLVLKNDDGEQRILCEFRTDDPESCEREFPLDGVGGKQNVSFTFLPGSNFDFNWFRFVK